MVPSARPPQPQFERVVQATRLVATSALGIMLAAVPASCAGSARAGGFDSPVPAARIDAVEATVAEWRSTPLVQRELPRDVREHLVECLRSGDDLLRFVTIEALAEMTGERRGYHYDDPPAARLGAIDAWRRWAEEVSDR